MAGITAKELAKRLGISPSAVSLALNDKPGVSQRTRNLVLETAMQLGYAKASAGVSHTGKTVCFIRYGGTVINAAEHTSFSSFVLQGVEARATELGYNTQVRYLNTGDMFNRQTLEFIRQAAGVVFLGTDLTPSQMPEMEQFFSNLDNCPVVIVDSFLLRNRVDCIGNDSFGGAYSAAEHLIQSGHTRLGYVKAKQRILNFRHREQGVQDAAANAGVEMPVSIDVDVSSEGAFRDFDAWLGTHPQLPDALFVENDIIAAAVMRVLKLHGYGIPEDISIMGFDDIPLCEMLDPPLSTVHLCKEELGTLAMDQLHRRITAGQVPHRMGSLPLVSTTLSTYLVPRASIKKR